MTEGVKTLALRHLERDANHISVGILLRQEASFVSWKDRFYRFHRRRHLDFRGFTGLHCIAYMGVAEIAIDMMNIKRWDWNRGDPYGDLTR